MFTGLIEEIGSVAAVIDADGGRTLTLRAERVLGDLDVDDSIAINGCCQTVIERSATGFTVTAVEETLKKTTLGELAEGDPVNLERSLKADGRLGGHFVLGHVDCVGTVTARVERGSSTVYSIGFPPEHSHLVIPVGSIAIDGVSLTTADVGAGTATVSIIPHTDQLTRFGTLQQGDRVNIEFDMLGKYVSAAVNRTGTV
jgi:riboflavin synthase